MTTPVARERAANAREAATNVVQCRCGVSAILAPQYECHDLPEFAFKSCIYTSSVFSVLGPISLASLRGRLIVYQLRLG